MGLEQIRPGDLTHDAVHWWELAGHDPVDLRQAWAQAHHAARVAALVGSSWAEPRGDGSHGSLTWMSGHGLLDGLFVSEPVAGERPMRGVLRLWNLDLLLVEETGVPIDQVSLVGMTLDEARAWMLRITSEQGDAPRRAPTPVRADPESPVSTSAEPFREISQLAQAELLRLYHNTSAVLEQVSWIVSGSSPVRVWPHSFELGVQVRFGGQDPEVPPRFIVMGLAPPGAFGETGYWYVAPWMASPVSGAAFPPKPGEGRWAAREGELAIAVLPVEAVTSTQERTEQHSRLACFFADAFNESVRLLGS